MRLDALTGEWVCIADHRQNRTFLPQRRECSLCPTRDATMPTEMPADEYDVVVFGNRFPSFAPESTVAGFPYDVTAATRLTDESLDAGKLVQRRDGEWILLGFITRMQPARSLERSALPCLSPCRSVSEPG